MRIFIFYFLSFTLGSCNAQNQIFEGLDNTTDQKYTLYVLRLAEQFGQDTTGESFYLEQKDLLKLNKKLSLTISNENYKCAGTHNLYLVKRNMVVGTGNVIPSCEQIIFKGKKFSFTEDDFELIKSKGKALKKSHYAFSDLEEARAFYSNQIVPNDEIIMKYDIEPKWFKYEGFFAVSIYINEEEEYKDVLKRVKERIGVENICLEYLSYGPYRNGIADFTFAIYCGYSFFESFEPTSVGLIDYKGKWKKIRKLELNVFKKVE
ncbi:MAG: hypothetical protein AAF806_21000 [Bacteroidota bacterium]